MRPHLAWNFPGPLGPTTLSQLKLAPITGAAGSIHKPNSLRGEGWGPGLEVEGSGQGLEAGD